MSNSLLDLLGIMPAEIVFTYAFTVLLPMRRTWAFWIIRLGLVAFVAVARSHFDYGFRAFFGFILACVVVPFVFSNGKASSRLLIIALVNVASIVSEVLLVALWTVLVGEAPVDYTVLQANPESYWLIRCVNVLVSLVLLAGLYALLRKFGKDGTRGGVHYFIWFPAAQLVLLLAMTCINIFFLPYSNSFAIGATVLVGFSVLTDTLLFVTLNRFGKRQIEEERARALGAQLDQYLRQYDEIVADMGQVAKTKHDLRNQLQVVSYLLAQGEVSKARTHLGAVEAFVGTAPHEGTSVH